MGDTGEIEDVEAALEKHLREQLWWWRVERALAVLLVAVTVGLGVLAMSGAALSPWVLVPAVLALALALPAARSWWTRRSWPAPSPDLRRLGYRRMTAVHTAIERGDPVEPEHRGLALQMRLTTLQLRCILGIMLAQSAAHAPQLGSSGDLDTLRLVLTVGFLIMSVWLFVVLEREARRAQRLLDAAPGDAHPAVP